VYISASGQYCSRNTSAVTHNQLESNLTQGTAAGECLAQESDANLIQQDVDPDTLTTTQEASLQKVTVEVGEKPYIVPGDTIADPSSLYGDGHLTYHQHSIFSCSVVVTELRSSSEYEHSSL
jgi:hypothetical protein